MREVRDRQEWPRVWAVIGVAATGVMFVGCSPADPPTSQTEPGGTTIDVTASNALPAQDRGNWVMPLDQYMVTGEQQFRESYLHALLSQECLTHAGFEHTVPEYNYSGVAGVGRMMFDVKIATTEGYRSYAHGSADEDWLAFIYRPMSDQEGTALDLCVREVVNDPDVPAWDAHEMLFASDLASAAVTGSFQDPAVVEAAEEWRACMAPLGVEDLPVTPDAMPSQSLVTKFGWNDPGVDDGPALTREELDVAVYDAECRESSNYSVTLYDAEWARQAELLATNLEALEGIRAVIEAKDAAISAAIASFVR